jgi:peptide/histidine transporter 3/4
VTKVKWFFTSWFRSINLGALLSYTLVAYVCQYGIPFLGGESWGFFVGYMIPTIALGLGIAVFMSATTRYKKFPPQGSMVSRAVGILSEGVTRRGQGEKGGHWLDVASVTQGGSYSPNEVESVKYVTRLFPYLAIMIPYWGIYGQTKTAFQIQGCQMNSKLGTFQLPISAMNIFNNVTILLLVPLFEQYMFPALNKAGYTLTMLIKIGMGFVFAIMAMIMAALIEVYRMQNVPANAYYEDQSARDNISPCRNIDNYNPYKYQEWYAGTNDDKPTNCWQMTTTACSNIPDGQELPLDCIECDYIPQMSHIHIFWQIPQFVLIGVSEIFASITSLEFFYSQAPASMRSVSQALNLFTNAVGSWLTIPLTLLVNANPNDPWIASDVNDGHLDYYYYLLAGLMAIGLVAFVWLARKFVYVLPEELEALNDTSGGDDTPAGECRNPVGSAGSARTMSGAGYVAYAPVVPADGDRDSDM